MSNIILYIIYVCYSQEDLKHKYYMSLMCCLSTPKTDLYYYHTDTYDKNDTYIQIDYYKEYTPAKVLHVLKFKAIYGKVRITDTFYVEDETRKIKLRLKIKDKIPHIPSLRICDFLEISIYKITKISW